MFARLSYNFGTPWRRQIKNFLEEEVASRDTEMGDIEEDDSSSSAFSQHDRIAELIPDFHPLHLAPFGSSRSYPTSPTTRSTSEVPVRTPQSMRNRHGRSNRNPWTVFSGSSGQPLVPESSHRIRHTASSRYQEPRKQRENDLSPTSTRAVTQRFHPPTRRLLTDRLSCL
jgi:hypothetical protein